MHICNSRQRHNGERSGQRYMVNEENSGIWVTLKKEAGSGIYSGVRCL